MNTGMAKNKNVNKLINGTIIYFIGTFLSKGLSIIMLPFITTYISSADYGYYDLIVTLVGLFLPIFTVQSIEAVFRFLFDANERKKKELLTNVWVVVIVGVLLFSVVFSVYNALIQPIKYIECFILYFIVTVIVTMYQRVARSCNKSKEFAISGIINAALLAIFQIGFIMLFNMGTESLYISYSLSTFITCIYLEKITRSARDFSIGLINGKCIKEVIKFSLPLVPNNISWWAASSLNKVIIVYFIGTSANGMYAVANKFAYILSTAASVFQMSWQETSITSYEEKDTDSFNSNIFNYYFQILFYFSFLAILLIKIFMPIFFGAEYQQILGFIPILFYGTCMSCISLFYGAGYISSKRTKGAFWTTIIGAGLNVFACIIFIIPLGLFAPAISTLVAYLVIWIIRHKTMKTYFKVKIQWNSILKVTIIGTITTSIYYIGNSFSICVTFVFISLYFCYLNRKITGIITKK